MTPRADKPVGDINGDITGDITGDIIIIIPPTGLSAACWCRVCMLFVYVGCCFTSTKTVGLLGTGAQDIHLDFRTTPELCNFSVALRPQKP